MNKGSAPLISSAGRNHVLLSKQFGIVVLVLLICGGVIFFRIEQNAVARSRLDDQHVREHNEMLKAKNSELKEAKSQLLKDEEELTKMYEKWLADDGKSLELNRDAIKELKAQIESVKNSQETHEALLGDKADALSDKEEILMNLHMQLVEKNTLMKSMKKQIIALNGTLPKMIEEQPDDDDWAW
eukprot:m.120577 g.120577  ORF g.120577 m.120577 type:complete len:185 (+) comp52085_c0_seq1:180-734(+)